jgi:hypothetical protein
MEELLNGYVTITQTLPNQINQEHHKRINFKNWENDVMSVWWLETSENRGN